jgi:diguanylate cyclase (GGDEF)-like protein
VDQEDALGVAERLRRETQSRRILLENEGSVKVTISLGAAQMRDTEDSDALFERADAALYQAKDQGRNQVVVAP